MIYKNSVWWKKNPNNAPNINEIITRSISNFLSIFREIDFTKFHEKFRENDFTKKPKENQIVTESIDDDNDIELNKNDDEWNFSDHENSRKPRSTISDNQSAFLKNYYNINPRPKRAELIKISEEIGMYTTQYRVVHKI